MPVKNVGGGAQAELDPIFTGAVKQTLSTSQTDVPSLNLLKTTKETLDTDVSAKASSSAVAAALATKEDLSNKSTNILLGTSDTLYPSQNAVKSYIDNFITGLKWKQSVLCATTANVTLSGEQTIDGVTTSASRVLVKNNSTGSQNGIYNTSSGAWTRVTDADANTELIAATVFVEQGTINGDTAWVCTNNTITIGSTSLVFAQVFGAGTFTAGTGLQLTGNQFSVDSTVTRQGNSFNGNSQLVQLNSSGQFPALDGRNLTNLPAPALNFTYGETITAGDVVYQKVSDGKVYKIPTTTPVYNTAPFDTTNQSICSNADGSIVVAIGRDSAGDFSVRAGSVSGNTVTWGTKQSVNAWGGAVPTDATITYNTSSGAWVIAYNNDSVSNYLYLRAFTVSGNTITLGTAVAVTSVTFSGLSSCDLSGTSSIVVGYKKSAANYFLRAYSISGTTLSAGTEYDTTINGNMGVHYDPINSRIMVANSGGIFVELINTSGTLSVSRGSFSNTYSTSLQNASVVPNARPLQYGFYYKGSFHYFSSSEATAFTMTLARLNVVTINSSNDYFAPIHVGSLKLANSTTIANWYLDGHLLYIVTTGINDIVVFNLETGVVETHLYFDGIVPTSSQRYCLFVVNNKIFRVGNFVSTTTYLRMLVANNISRSELIGIANASGVANDSKEVKIGKSVYTTTGLTAGARYHIATDGTLSKDKAGIYLGKAISTTQLLLDI